MTCLRPARDGDAGRIGAILSEFIDTTPWMPRVHTRAEDIAHAAAMIARGWVSVAEREGGVTGFAACNGPELNALYVGADHRGQGTGGALLKSLKHAQAHLELWTFQENIRAQAFYQTHGFAEIERTDGARNDEGLPDVRYVWKREAS